MMAITLRQADCFDCCEDRKTFISRLENQSNFMLIVVRLGRVYNYKM